MDNTNKSTEALARIEYPTALQESQLIGLGTDPTSSLVSRIYWTGIREHQSIAVIIHGLLVRLTEGSHRLTILLALRSAAHDLKPDKILSPSLHTDDLAGPNTARYLYRVQAELSCVMPSATRLFHADGTGNYTLAINPQLHIFNFHRLSSLDDAIINSAMINLTE